LKTKIDKNDLEQILHDYFPFGFPISKKIWNWLEIGKIINASQSPQSPNTMYAIRQIVDHFNKRKKTASGDSRIAYAGVLYSIGLILDASRYLVHLYCNKENSGIWQKGIDSTKGERDDSVVEFSGKSFVTLFPPRDFLILGEDPLQYLKSQTGKNNNLPKTVSEMILVALSNSNPAFKDFLPFFDDTEMRENSNYGTLIELLEKFFATQPPFSYLELTLFDCLRAPIIASPDSVEGQIEYIRKYWAAFLPDELLDELTLASDILKEEAQIRGMGPGSAQILDFIRKTYGADYGYPEPDRFSADADWMSNVVILAKSIYVWLDQLSKKYQRHIHTLGDIPDEELDLLARWGFSGLWLIGVWERSPASQKIKQIMGNPEALSSAYSLFDYVIADDLGGEEAYQNLRERTWRKGIRLASDMVPNHMGIYSKWVIEHPEWFIQLDYPPYPSYQFNGADLSWDDRVALQIEDGYWSHRDAAVVFKRTDKWTGNVCYIYHGNDGTSMPWNDTAQLNYLIPEVREAVIQTILHVARKFPIIRFDAAMTLAKRHYHRLWFPPHGEGGAIPSRAEHGLSKQDFDAAMPNEFWREVVDRVAAELPDTLLLAEAFWLMEGYFVRTLGMHRVYNSAFMNMLKMEENGKYRQTVKNVLEFSPEILKRFVNFMNNPDEATAEAQFGKGDKYIGICLMMVTMPGLPMFGHGQIEGFKEKYGMEYRRAYWDEPIDRELVSRHEMEIFPLMKFRRLFSSSQNFAFFDFVKGNGEVDENVFAYSNFYGDQRAIIVYNNAYNATSGTIHTSTAINVGKADDKYFARKNLADALKLNTAEGFFYTFRDHKTDLEYIRSGIQIQKEGLFAQLYGYQYHALIDFSERHDSDGLLFEATRRLAGNGIMNLDDYIYDIKIEPIISSLKKSVRQQISDTASELLKPGIREFLAAVDSYYHRNSEIENISLVTKGYWGNIRKSIQLLAKFEKKELDPCLLLSHVIIGHIMAAMNIRFEPNAAPVGENIAALFDEWRLEKNISAILNVQLNNLENSLQNTGLVKLLIKYQDKSFFPSEKVDYSLIIEIMADDDCRKFLNYNLYNDVTWFSKERMEELLKYLTVIQISKDLSIRKTDNRYLTRLLDNMKLIITLAEKSQFRLDEFLKSINQK